jgi:uncharacterized protein
MITLGIIGDTHVPDRARSLHPGVLPLFSRAGVTAILHAGDISGPGVLAELGQVAPVYAVRGNRDILWLRELPLERRLIFEGVTIGLSHGHGGWRRYLRDKPHHLLFSYKHEWLVPRLVKIFPDVQVIVFGHGHLPLNQWMNGQLLFNPGFPLKFGKNDLAPTAGLLYLSTRSEIRGEIVNLDDQSAA